MQPVFDTHSRIDLHRQVELLANAASVTIVGTSNEWVVNCIEDALDQKRIREANSDAFWDKLSVVFLSEQLLENIKDHFNSEFPDPQQAVERRIRRTGQVKRQLMSFLLRRGGTAQWSLYTCSHNLPLIGSIFEMTNGDRVIQLTFPSGLRAEQDCLTVEISGKVDHGFDETFRQVLEQSREEHEVVLVGAPAHDSSFRFSSARFRRALLRGGQNMSDWLPAILAVTWRQGEFGAEPLLQVNTPQSSTREMGKASHVSGYINERDVLRETESETESHSATVLSASSTERALYRELASDFAIFQLASPLELLDVIRFYYPDKENLFFYVYNVQISAAKAFEDSAQMFSWKYEELERVRLHQVVANAMGALTSQLTEAQRNRMSELVQVNLRAHGRTDVAVMFARAVRSGDHADLNSHLAGLLAETSVKKYVAGRELAVSGLAGLQYRCFYSHLLPFYADIGVAGADFAQRAIQNDPERQASVAQLANLYQNEQYICSLPIEV